MKIQLISDIHLEFSKVPSIWEDIINCNSDVIVIAGDLATYKKEREGLLDLYNATNKPIISIPGNHTFYGTKRSTFEPMLRDFSDKHDHIHVLCEDILIMKDIVFLGSTGWWDGSGGPITQDTVSGLNDFRLIYDVMDNDMGRDWGRESKKFFIDYIKFFKGKDMKVVCVSHHMPHPKCTHPQYAGSPLNTCFCNDWSDLIDEYQPDLWLCGHTHTNIDFQVGKTRIACNPQGYPSIEQRRCADGQREEVWTIENPKFNPQLVIEV